MVSLLPETYTPGGAGWAGAEVCQGNVSKPTAIIQVLDTTSLTPANGFFPVLSPAMLLAPCTAAPHL